jgi:hypothetical protein
MSIAVKNEESHATMSPDSCVRLAGSGMGSDSHSMMFACGLVLFQENQHHAIQLSDFVLDSERICRR